MILQVMQHGDDAAKLANTSVQSIISAYNNEPGIEHTRLLNEALRSGTPDTLEHTRLLNDALRRSTPGSIEHQRLMNELNTVKLVQERALGNLPADLLRQQVEAARNKNQRIDRKSTRLNSSHRL